MTFLDFLKVKIYENMLQKAPFKKKFRGSMPPNPPPANAWLRHASQAPPPQKKK